MASDRLLQLLDELSHATRDGRVQWQETAQEGAFRIALGEGLVRIETVTEMLSEQNYHVSLLDKHGRTVDELEADAHHGYWELVQGLYHLARSSALKEREDEIVDSMLSELKASRIRDLSLDAQSDDRAF